MESEVAKALERVVAQLPQGGEVRLGQIEMAEAVARGITEKRHVIVQAGTGVGKSLAYLLPAILSGAKCVVATATKALQDQLADKELPFLAEHLGLPFEFSVVKGRSNYLCRQRALEVAGGGDQLALDQVDDADLGPLGLQVARILRWAVDTKSGDRSDLDFEPSARAWAQVSVTAMECPGAARCPSGDACFAEAARQRADEADVVVVNTHLYGTHLASGGHVLPEHDVVVFDEAHELEDVASASLGLELGAGRFRALARNARGIVAAEDRQALDELEAVGDRWEAALTPWRDKRLPAGFDSDISAVLALAQDRAERASRAIRMEKSSDEARRSRALQAAGHLVGDLDFIVSMPDSFVAWVEGPPHAPVFRMAPVDVGPLLSEKLWGNATAILTSATIPAGLANRVGIDRETVDELDVGSPFPYAENALLYCATHMPDPRNPTFEPAVHKELEQLITAAGGRTLALFTSWKGMNAAADALRDRVPWRVLTQSDLPKPALLDAFASDETSCLFATMGFWQGVDVVGRALSLVVIDKLPFPRPDEPLLQARRDLAGATAFRVVDLPRAATLLAQGAGRLIRSATDRGVVAVLDPRLGKAGYRWDLVRALPPMRRTKDIEEVKAFLAHLHE